MTNNYEVHCVVIERTSSSASVTGTISEGPMSGVKGRSSTVHSSHVVASGKSYQHQQFNDAYPFTAGERMVFLCVPDSTTGAFRIISLVNLSTGTYRFHTTEMNKLRWKLMLFISVAMCLSVIGWFTTPFAVAWYIHKRKKVWPILDNANEALDNALKSSKKDRASMERAIGGFNGPKFVGLEFT